MTLKLFISGYTYRTEAMQLETLRKEDQLKDAPVFRPEDSSIMFRPSTRPERDTYYAASVACFAGDEDEMKEFIAACRRKKSCLASIEENFSWTPHQSTGGAIKAWKAARVAGSATVGGSISAKRREERSREACDKIKDRWPLPSQIWGTPALLKEAGLSYNTAIKFLGKRPIVQYNYAAKMKRKERYERQQVN